jgi:GNAT superfamily N-acetyltransferase
MDEGSPTWRIRRAGAHEGERLREIAIAAKSYWGYELDDVRRWAAAGDFSAEALSGELYVAEADGRPIAWAALIAKGDVVWLDDLWVEPDWIGRGVGSHLFHHAVDCARQLGARRLEWDAEPHAVGFYARMGARYLREGEPSAWGRVIPVMGLDLSR